MLPVFREKADTPAMIHHALKLIQKQTNHLNPGQTPVMTADQPLYAIAKQIQWAKSETLGEEKFLVLMGDLHIEMTFMICLGTFSLFFSTSILFFFLIYFTLSGNF